MNLTEALNSSTVARLLNRRFLPSLIIPIFTDPPMSRGSNSFERAILESIERHNTKLKFYKTEALQKNEEFLTQKKVTVYKLYSDKHAAWAVFTIQEHTGQFFANVLMLLVIPICQGNFFTLKDFFLNYLSQSLFDAGVVALMGSAIANSTPVRNPRHDFRKEKTKDGVSKLVRLYELLGCERMRFDSIIFTREMWEAARMPRKGSRLASGAFKRAGEPESTLLRH